MKIPELLAPAGSFDALKAAVSAGADAVYLGMTNFSARAFAGNFDHDEMIEAVKYAHARNCRIYVTVNTMLYETEIANAIKDIDFLYHADVDALLIQDFGLFHYVRQCYPDFDVHCSTQMHIHNLAGVKFMQTQGAARVVMARETPIEVIAEAVKTGMEIEVFAYGAICISYSGQCLMSSALKNRSANKGMCAQCCRLRYFREDGTPFEEGEYILSPKDLNVLDRLEELMDAGVSSLKIEGRMKRPEYVWLVVKTFREAIDAIAAGKEYRLSEKRKKDLLLMFNRGFSQGHLFHNSVKQRMSWYRPNHMGVTIGTVVRYEKGRVLVKLEDRLNQNDGLRILNDSGDIGLTAVKIEKNGRLVNAADAGDTVWLSCPDHPVPKKGQKLQKTSDKLLIEEIDRNIEESRTTPVEVSYTAEEGKPFAVTIRDDRGNEAYAESEFIVQPAKSAPLSSVKIETALRKTAGHPYEVTSVSGEPGNIFMPVSVMNETRRAAMDQLNEMRFVLHPARTSAKEYAFACPHSEERTDRIILLCEKEQNEVYEHASVLRMSDPIQPMQNEPAEQNNIVLSQAGDLYMQNEHCIAGMNLNIANSYAMAYLLSQKGIDGILFSSEISNDQIHSALDAFEKRYGFVPWTARLVYGRRTLMYIKDRFLGGSEPETISDLHGNLFKVTYNEDKAEIHEAAPFVSDNPYCSASAVLMEESRNKNKEIVEEAYEEFHERIQRIRP